MTSNRPRPMPPADVAFCRDFIAARRWQYAKTMPQAPHEYTVRDWDGNVDAFQRFVHLSREYGTTENYWKHVRAYLYVDDWKYWTMGAPVEETTVINRADHYSFYGRQQADIEVLVDRGRSVTA